MWSALFILAGIAALFLVFAMLDETNDGMSRMEKAGILTIFIILWTIAVVCAYNLAMLK